MDWTKRTIKYIIWWLFFQGGRGSVIHLLCRLIWVTVWRPTCNCFGPRMGWGSCYICIRVAFKLWLNGAWRFPCRLMSPQTWLLVFFTSKMTHCWLYCCLRWSIPGFSWAKTMLYTNSNLQILYSLVCISMSVVFT